MDARAILEKLGRVGGPISRGGLHEANPDQSQFGQASHQNQILKGVAQTDRANGSVA